MLRADAFATAFMAMDLEASIGGAKSQQKQLDAFIIYVDEKGDTQGVLNPWIYAMYLQNNYLDLPQE